MNVTLQSANMIGAGFNRDSRFYSRSQVGLAESTGVRSGSEKAINNGSVYGLVWFAIWIELKLNLVFAL